VVVLHDTDGRGRAAFAVAAYLVWTRAFATSRDSARHVFQMRLGHQAGTQARFRNSWMYLLACFDSLMSLGRPVMPARAHLLRIVLQMNGEVEKLTRPLTVQVFCGEETVWDSRDCCGDTGGGRYDDGDDDVFDEFGGQNAHLSGRGGSSGGEFLCESGFVKCEVQRIVAGDVMIQVSADIATPRRMKLYPSPLGDLPDMSLISNDFYDETVQKKVLMRHAFHTSLVPGAAYSVFYDDVDAPSEKLVIKEGFQLTLMFAPVSPGGNGVDLGYGRDGAEGSSGAEPEAAAGGYGVGSDSLTLSASPQSGTRPNEAASLPAPREKAWYFTQYLNLRGKLARLAGLRFASLEHAVFPETQAVAMLAMRGHREFLAIAALQFCERNMFRAETMLRTRYMAALAAAFDLFGFAGHSEIIRASLEGRVHLYHAHGSGDEVAGSSRRQPRRWRKGRGAKGKSHATVARGDGAPSAVDDVASLSGGDTSDGSGTDGSGSAGASLASSGHSSNSDDDYDDNMHRFTLIKPPRPPVTAATTRRPVSMPAGGPTAAHSTRGRPSGSSGGSWFDVGSEVAAAAKDGRNTRPRSMQITGSNPGRVGASAELEGVLGSRRASSADRPRTRAAETHAAFADDLQIVEADAGGSSGGGAAPSVSMAAGLLGLLSGGMSLFGFGDLAAVGMDASMDMGLEGDFDVDVDALNMEMDMAGGMGSTYPSNLHPATTAGLLPGSGGTGPRTGLGAAASSGPAGEDALGFSIILPPRTSFTSASGVGAAVSSDDLILRASEKLMMESAPSRPEGPIMQEVIPKIATAFALLSASASAGEPDAPQAANGANDSTNNLRGKDSRLDSHEEIQSFIVKNTYLVEAALGQDGTSVSSREEGPAAEDGWETVPPSANPVATVVATPTRTHRSHSAGSGVHGQNNMKNIAMGAVFRDIVQSPNPPLSLSALILSLGFRNAERAETADKPDDSKSLSELQTLLRERFDPYICTDILLALRDRVKSHLDMTMPKGFSFSPATKDVLSAQRPSQRGADGPFSPRSTSWLEGLLAGAVIPFERQPSVGRTASVGGFPVDGSSGAPSPATGGFGVTPDVSDGSMLSAGELLMQILKSVSGAKGNHMPSLSTLNALGVVAAPGAMAATGTAAMAGVIATGTGPSSALGTGSGIGPGAGVSGESLGIDQCGGANNGSSGILTAATVQAGEPKADKSSDQPSSSQAAPISAEQQEAKLKKFRLMLKNGVPPVAVENTMRREGFPEESIKAVLSGASATAISADSGPKKTPDENALMKFRTMLKSGVPPMAVEQAMRRENIDDALIARIISEGSTVVAEQKPDDVPEKAKDAPADASAPSDSAELLKFQMMLKNGVPPMAVVNAMQRLGFSSDDISRVVPGAQLSAAPAAVDSELDEAQELKKLVDTLKAEQRALAEDLKRPRCETQRYGTFFTMVKRGVPADVVKQKMTLASIDPAILDGDAQTPVEAMDMLKDDQKYARFFKMLKMGIPKAAVENKMKAETVNHLALELDPELPTPSGLSIMPGGRLSSLQNASAKAAQAAALKRAKAKSLQTRKLHWEVISEDRLQGNGNTIWAEASGLGDDSDEEELFETSELKQLFTQDQSAVEKSGPAAGSGSSAAAKIITVLDAKRGRGVAIGLAKLKVAHKIVRQCLLGLTYSYRDALESPQELSHDALVLLEDILPTPDEIALVKPHRAHVDRLAEAEKFFLVVADVPKSKLRANALAYQRLFDFRVKEIKGRVDMLTSSCGQVRTSQRLRRVLEATLKLGNKLNSVAEGEDFESIADAAASPAPGHGRVSSRAKNTVKGFSLGSLLKLGHTRSFNGKTSLLHYLVAALEKKEVGTCLLIVELPGVEAATRCGLEIIRNDLKALKDGLAVAERLIREQARSEESLVRPRTSSNAACVVSKVSIPGSAASASASAHSPIGSPKHPSRPAVMAPVASDQSSAISVDSDVVIRSSGSSSASGAEDTSSYVPESMAEFVARAQTNLQGLQSEIEESTTVFKELLTFFGEDTSTSVESFFSTLHVFARSLVRAQADNVAEMQKANREAARKAAAESTVKKGPRSIPEGPQPTPMDLLRSALKSEQPFSRLRPVSQRLDTAMEDTDVPDTPVRTLDYSEGDSGK
jgi:intracellular sulfur oxidation DsrE/DsrF family protein